IKLAGNGVMAAFQTPKLHGYSVKFSPFSPTRFACVACEQYGISGSAALLVFEFPPDLSGPPVVVQNCRWSDGLFDLCWSELDPDICVTAGGDGAIQVWNVLNKEPIAVLKNHEKEVYSVDWSHKGDKNLVLSSSWDSSCRVWDVPSGRSVPLVSFAHHSGVVYSGVWSPHVPGTFATTSADGASRVWDLREPLSPQSILPAHEGEVLSCDWSKYDANILVTGSVDCSLKVWDIRNPRSSLCLMRGHDYAVRRVRCSPFSRGIIASCSYDFTVRTWDYMRPQGFTPRMEVLSHHTEFVYGLDFSSFVPSLLADCAWDESIRLYKPKSLLSTD
uniref:Peroxin-7 n=1 Tax=Ciona savignyi TaxID=51511 RepID=H2YS78_CIOSA